MTNILNAFRRLFKYRRHQRYHVTGGTLVVIASHQVDGRDLEVQLIDISKGGMAFIYQGSPSDLEASGILKTKPSGPKIDFEAVSDIPVPGSTATSEGLWRRGVKFKWLGFYQKEELADFIKEVGICET